MQFSRDEYLLLSRTGRVPHSARPRPDPHPVSELSRPAIRFPLDGWIGAARAGVRSLRGRRGSAAGVPDSYLELEFVVGFGADDEPSA